MCRAEYQGMKESGPRDMNAKNNVGASNLQANNNNCNPECNELSPIKVMGFVAPLDCLLPSLLEINGKDYVTVFANSLKARCLTY